MIETYLIIKEDIIIIHLAHSIGIMQGSLDFVRVTTSILINERIARINSETLAPE
mgnify:CR=1 FL=1